MSFCYDGAQQLLSSSVAFLTSISCLSNYQSRAPSAIMKVVYDPKKEMSLKTELLDEWLHVGVKQYTISARKGFYVCLLLFFFNKGDHFEHNCYVTHA